jgi:outer membrane immunogenic protein
MRGHLFSTAAVATIGLTQIALAADMPVKAPMPPPPPFSWTGFYLGGNIGGAWARRTWDDVTRGVALGQADWGHFIAGGQVGYNWQVNSFVIGIEADGDWLQRKNEAGAGVIVAGIPIAVDWNRAWIATAAGRFGIVTAANKLLAYGKAGGGWIGEDRLTITNVTTGASITDAGRSRGGWLVGGGVEYALNQNWTLKAEYDYLGLDRRTFVVPASAPFLAGDVFTNRGRDVQEFKIGFNYLVR